MNYGIIRFLQFFCSFSSRVAIILDLTVSDFACGMIVGARQRINSLWSLQKIVREKKDRKAGLKYTGNDEIK